MQAFLILLFSMLGGSHLGNLKGGIMDRSHGLLPFYPFEYTYCRRSYLIIAIRSSQQILESVHRDSPLAITLFDE